MTKIDMADVYMCRRCGAVVANSAAAKHGDWHERIEDVLRSVEAADALARERLERGDG